MKKQTRFTPGQSGWFMLQNKPFACPIKSVIILVETSEFSTELSTRITYRMREVRMGDYFYHEVAEENLFETKEELLKSL
jgi:hypothetical protein